MDLKLTIVFAHLRVKGFSILNPPSIPAEGEAVTIPWEDFVKDPNDLDMIRKAERESGFFAHIGRHIAKDHVEVYVMLWDEALYIKNFGPVKPGTDKRAIPPDL